MRFLRKLEVYESLNHTKGRELNIKVNILELNKAKLLVNNNGIV